MTTVTGPRTKFCSSRRHGRCSLRARCLSRLACAASIPRRGALGNTESNLSHDHPPFPPSHTRFGHRAARFPDRFRRRSGAGCRHDRGPREQPAHRRISGARARHRRRHHVGSVHRLKRPVSAEQRAGGCRAPEGFLHRAGPADGQCDPHIRRPRAARFQSHGCQRAARRGQIRQRGETR